MDKARGVQSWTQIPQALQSSVSIRGFAQKERLTGTQAFPLLSLIAPLGQILPQTPQLTQRSGLISWRVPLSPDMAKTGQGREQAVHPVHFSPITYAESFAAIRLALLWK